MSIAPPCSVFTEKDEMWAGSARRRSRHTSVADQALTLGALAGKLAGAAHRLRLLAGALLGWLLVVSAHLHFAENAFALHLLLERAKRLVNIVVADEYLHVSFLSLGAFAGFARRTRLRIRGAAAANPRAN
jgi:hypothetical protein